jgi:uncharacterized protein
MKRILIGVMCAVLGLGVVAATDSVRSARAASSDSVALQLSRMVLSKSGYEQMTKQMVDSILSASGQAADDKTKQKLAAVVLEALPYDEMLQLNAKVYGERFKDGELQDIITFYKTPTGLKLVRELPNISGEVGTTVAKVVQERLPALLKKHGLTH